MKIKQLALCLVTIAVAMLTNSCGGSKYADTKQIKSYVLMTSVEVDLSRSYTDDFFTDIYLGKIKLKKLPDVTETFLDEEGHPDVNPVLEYARVFIKNNTVSGWGTAADWEPNMYNELCTEYMNSPYTCCDQLYDVYINDLENAKNMLSSLDEEFSRSGYCDISMHNTLMINIYRLEHPVEHRIAVEEIFEKYVDYIGKKADKTVKVKDTEVDKSSTTKNCNGYFVTYKIGDDFYVLVNLTEEKETGKFEIKTLYRGSSMIELDRALENNKFEY